jgi:uncharacterized protein (TIGR00730 family)
MTSYSKRNFKDLVASWPAIKWIDVRTYTDVDGGQFRAVDLSRRPELANMLPEVEPHEIKLIRKIQKHSNDLQFVIREEHKTPDLIVDGVMTEMKSLSNEAGFLAQLDRANVQVLEHADRHKLTAGAAAIDLTLREAVPVDKVLADINNHVRAGRSIGLARVSVYAGQDRQVFVRGAGGLFSHQAPRLGVKPAALPRYLIPNSLGLAVAPDPNRILREVVEPAKRLSAAGVRATVTVYGSARILSPTRARAELDALVAQYGRRPRRPVERGFVQAARRALEASHYYEVARAFGRLVATHGKGEVAVVTGGGPGIMAAANRGARELGGPSVGYSIILEKEKGPNKYLTPGLNFEFEHFATRKMALRHGAMGLVYFPGGYGTMDELFEVLTLMQTRKMPRVPIVLIGEKSYWERVVNFQELSNLGLISPEDLSMFRFAETAEDAWRAIAGTPR